MTRWHEDVRGLLEQVSLTGLPAQEPWIALLEIGDEKVGLRVAGRELALVEDVGINASWDFSYTMTADEWERFCARPAGRGWTTAQAVVATQGADRVRGDRAVWARGAVV